MHSKPICYIQSRVHQQISAKCVISAEDVKMSHINGSVFGGHFIKMTNPTRTKTEYMNYGISQNSIKGASLKHALKMITIGGSEGLYIWEKNIYVFFAQIKNDLHALETFKRVKLQYHDDDSYSDSTRAREAGYRLYTYYLVESESWYSLLRS